MQIARELWKSLAFIYSALMGFIWFPDILEGLDHEFTDWFHWDLGTSKSKIEYG